MTRAENIRLRENVTRPVSFFPLTLGVKKQRFVRCRRCRVSCTWGASKTVRGFRNSPSPTFRSRPAGEHMVRPGGRGMSHFGGGRGRIERKSRYQTVVAARHPGKKRSSLINRTHGALSNRPRTRRASYRAEIISRRTPHRIADTLPPPWYAHYPTKVFLPVFITNGKQTQIGRELRRDLKGIGAGQGPVRRQAANLRLTAVLGFARCFDSLKAVRFGTEIHANEGGRDRRFADSTIFPRRFPNTNDTY